MCYTFDRIYGLPGRAPFTELIREKGFDGFLSEGSSTTQYAQKLLQSTDIVEYTMGIDLLNTYLFDGGHTSFYPVTEMNEDILQQVMEGFGSVQLDPTGSVNASLTNYSVSMSRETIQNARAALFESADYVEQMNTSVYCEKGDTAFFCFDSFLTDIDAWVAYYTQEGEMPMDMVSEFYLSLSKAEQNPAIKRFVLDVSLNGGGYTMIAQYMMGVLADATASYNIDNRTGQTTEIDYTFDKNLDKEINDLDKDLKFDLQYAVLASQCSFSSGNLLPSLAHDNGVLLLGERTGGGSCTVQYYITPDGMCYSLSSGTCMADKNYESIDLGIQPDYELFVQNEDGTKDFSASYDVTILDRCFDEFYGTVVTDPVETTLPAETTDPAVTDPAETTLPAETTTTEETTTTVTETTAAETEPTPFASPEKMGEMAKIDYESQNGTAPAASETKDNGDGTYSIILSDENGDVIDTYTVDLPQTGNNAVGTAAAVTAAAALTLMGALMIGSAIFRKKDGIE